MPSRYQVVFWNLENLFDIKIEREGEFKSLGTLNYENPKQLIFIEDKKYLSEILNKKHITCIITTKDLISFIPSNLGVAISSNPKKSFYEVHF